MSAEQLTGRYCWHTRRALKADQFVRSCLQSFLHIILYVVHDLAVTPGLGGDDLPLTVNHVPLLHQAMSGKIPLSQLDVYSHAVGQAMESYIASNRVHGQAEPWTSSESGLNEGVTKTLDAAH